MSAYNVGLGVRPGGGIVKIGSVGGGGQWECNKRPLQLEQYGQKTDRHQTSHEHPSEILGPGFRNLQPDIGDIPPGFGP